MVESKKEFSEREERRRAIAVLKRESVIESIKAVHAMIPRANSDPDFVSEFILNVDGLDTSWSQYKVEDNTVLECLVNLGKAREYVPGQSGELQILINSAKAAANLLRPARTAPPVGQNVGNSSSVSDASSGTTLSRLPEIPLPIFGGDFHLWPTFRDTFTKQVDSRKNLSNVDKLYYLTGCLHGVALDAIRSIPASDDNYQLIWSTLSARFYRPCMVATSLLEKVLNAPSSSQESLHDLTVFLSTFDENISLLSAMDIPELGSFILFTSAFRALPLATRKLFESTIASTDVYPSVDKLLKFVRDRITVLENVGEPRKTSAKPKPQPVTGLYVSHRAGKSNPVALVAAKPTESRPQITTSSCPCCQGSHSISSCLEFRSWSLDERNRWAHEKKVCFNCLSGNHFIRACSSKSRCHLCSKKHHTLLHGVTPTRQEEGGDSGGKHRRVAQPRWRRI